MLLRIVALGSLIGAISPAYAQEAFSVGLPQIDNPASEPAVPETAWLDLRQQPAAGSTAQSAPNWVEAVNMTPAATNDAAAKTVFRIRMAHPVGDYQVLFFRLFFDDKPSARPEVVAWDESGTQ